MKDESRRYNSLMFPQLPSSSELAVPASLHWAHPIVQEWFVTRFGTPTEPQVEGWPSIHAGATTLISAPTGSGKTLAAFLVCSDRLLRKRLQGHYPLIPRLFTSRL